MQENLSGRLPRKRRGCAHHSLRRGAWAKAPPREAADYHALWRVVVVDHLEEFWTCDVGLAGVISGKRGRRVLVQGT